MLIDFTEKIVDGIFASLPRVRPSAYQANNGLLIAHRGAHDNNKSIFENTHQAFQRAQDLGCWGIEFDVHATADGVFVINHDPDLSRLWQKEVNIEEVNFIELRALVPEIPSLAEVIALYGASLHLFIELKIAVKNPQALLNALSACEPIKHYHLLTLNPDFYEGLDSLPGEALLLVAGHNNVQEFCDLSLRKPYGGVLGNYLLLTNKKRKKLLNAQQATGVGFVNSKNSLYRELNREVSWLFTNEALRVSRYLNHLRFPS
ncbi:glycerophosphodiester phosphodiesterase family protein [Legionella sp. km772]|uniref:glycerophosphodiester phosphodiesterase n=1 Tax=Legionella sp. km772 TaxID=2498111 RepID=UPI000F8EA962|nr:glycerophosphodiester phosphodiesterase family protein [Legionella sp. km772]RUR05742.1 glycerophosphodiester phosphodiesterase [Legionella sp. km772]